MNRTPRLTFIIALIVLLIYPAYAQDSSEPTPTAVPRPFPSTVITQNGMTVELYFETIAQGGIGLVYVQGEGIAGARARFLNRLVEFFPAENDGYYALLAVSMEQTPRLYDLAIFAWYPDNSRITLNTQVEVVRGQFIRQAIGVPADRAYLIDPQVERHEFAHLDSIITTLTPEQYWDGKGFQLPANSEFTSPFGAFRTLNQTVSTRHTGWDMTAPTGTPVHAMSAGKVAFAGQLDIRGNHIIIDHGFGIFSGYSHLSEILVSRQQTISQGQIIGLTGNTGRGNGPHLHWEIIVNGVWVDSRQFIETWLPVGNGSG